MIAIDPPITFRPVPFGLDPEPLGSDRFALMLSREDAARPRPAHVSRFGRAKLVAGDPAGAPAPGATAV